MTNGEDLFEARLERVLRDGVERISVGLTIPPLPTSPAPIRPGGTQRKRVGRRRLIGTGVVVGLALAGTAVAAATSAPPKVSYDPGAKISPAPDAIIQAVTAVLPAGATIVTSQHVQAGTSDHDDIMATAVDGSQYTFDVYNHFAASELDGFGLPKSRLSGGTLWIGADAPTGRSVYFLSALGVAVYVRSDSPTGHAAPLSDVTTEATRLATALGGGGG